VGKLGPRQWGEEEEERKKKLCTKLEVFRFRRKKHGAKLGQASVGTGKGGGLFGNVECWYQGLENPFGFGLQVKEESQ